MTTTVLNPQRVGDIFSDCLLKADESGSDHVAVEGIAHTAHFHPARLRGYEHEIAALLGQLPSQFKQSAGGGWSFLNACLDGTGELWTGEHRIIDQLFLLGIATGRAAYLFPRVVWVALPGGMPYVVVLDTQKTTS